MVPPYISIPATLREDIVLPKSAEHPRKLSQIGKIAPGLEPDSRIEIPRLLHFLHCLDVRRIPSRPDSGHASLPQSQQIGPASRLTFLAATSWQTSSSIKLTVTHSGSIITIILGLSRASGGCGVVCSGL